jgi:hypothetical protein
MPPDSVVRSPHDILFIIINGIAIEQYFNILVTVFGSAASYY